MPRSCYTVLEMIPRANRCKFFVINDYPILKQLEFRFPYSIFYRKGDISNIRGFFNTAALPLDIQCCFTANPIGLYNRGSL